MSNANLDGYNYAWRKSTLKSDIDKRLDNLQDNLDELTDQVNVLDDQLSYLIKSVEDIVAMTSH
tara:strand:- start:35 stop:226 length:192 start_codon:yes stop_codon:yes gene_type:complete